MTIADVIFKAGHIPHLLSKVDPATKNSYKKKYRKIKKISGIGAITLITSTTLVELVKDVSTSKLKAYGYKTIFLLAGGPVIQVIALPLYIFSNATKLRKVAIAAMEIGSEISRGEMELATFLWIFIDVLIFGEYVSTTEGENWMFLRNETSSKISEVVDSIGVGSD
jgi:hypothetical protein